MAVLNEILEWSVGRPAWQRDALRRLVREGELSDEDIQDLTEICKATHGLAEPVDPDPLTGADVPTHGASGSPVSLASIFHHRGVNALAEGQTLTLSPNLTVVYGDNAAGKTGYIRILKSACRARRREEILGNVVSGATPLSPIVAIKYRVGDEKGVREWAGDGEDEFISRVSVFDAQSATVYLTEKTDVAFRPFGLDLFDKLVRACKAIRGQLEREQRSLTPKGIVELQAKVVEGTSVARLISNITSLTKPETVHDLCGLSDGDTARLAQLERSLVDLQARDPDKLVRELSLRLGRIEGLSKHIREVGKALSAEAVDTILDTRIRGRGKRDEAAGIRERTFREDMLDGTGSETWTALSEAARRFSLEYAYPDERFPVTHDGAHCVLCQQTLDRAARQKLDAFEVFVRSTVEKELQEVRNRFANLRQVFVDLVVWPEAITETLEELKIENAAAAEAVSDWLRRAEDRRRQVVVALSEDVELAECPELDHVDDRVEAILTELRKRVQTLRDGKAEDVRTPLNVEVQELRARRTLAEQEEVVLAEIDRRRRLAAYGLCVDDTRTQAITRKSSTVTRKVVTKKLKESFREELSRLGFDQIEVELTDAGGAEGVLYHKIVLSRAPGVELPKVVSEGEQRCLSIAAFFAELSTAEDPSAIVFDDPVSSLDYRWREAVAKRLAEEARVRQVVVFTHDIVFLLALKGIADDLDIYQADQHVRHLSNGAGVCVGELPWVALKVRRRIGHLKQRLQAAERLNRDGHKAAYETEASLIYGPLREAWERGLEEVLLAGVVERFRPGVQTQQIGVLADVEREDCKAVERAMTKCSKWLPGHDQAAAAPDEMPGPAELGADIDALETWVKAINKRRD